MTRSPVNLLILVFEIILEVDGIHYLQLETAGRGKP